MSVHKCLLGVLINAGNWSQVFLSILHSDDLGIRILVEKHHEVTLDRKFRDSQIPCWP